MFITKSTRPPHPDDRLAKWYSQKSTYLEASDQFSSFHGSAEGSDAASSHVSAEPLYISIGRTILAIFGWLIPLAVGILLLALLHTFLN
jgi:hypothetical protein